MTQSTDQRESLAARVGAASAVLREAGYRPIDPAIIQVASPFLDLGGEEIRASPLLYDRSGRGGALPAAGVHHSDLPRLSGGWPRWCTPARFSCAGPVFRFRSGEPDEFVQVGLESFGRTDTAAADAEILGLAIDAVTASGCGPLATVFGDAGLLTALLDALQLPATWQRRLKRGLDKGEQPASILAAAPGRASDHAGVLAALAGTDEAGARALVDDLLSIAGIASVGGRSASEIAERFLGQVALRTAPAFGREQQAVLERYLAIHGEPDASAADLRALARDAGLDLGAALDLFEERISFMAVQGVDLRTTTFSGAFRHNLDYYTGFVFQARSVGAPGGPVLTGGRYDRLAQSLGSTVAIPAVGAAIWADRLGSAGQGTSTP